MFTTTMEHDKWPEGTPQSFGSIGDGEYWRGIQLSDSCQQTEIGVQERRIARQVFQHGTSVIKGYEKQKGAPGLVKAF